MIGLKRIANFRLPIANLKFPTCEPQIGNWQLGIGNDFSQLENEALFRQRAAYRHCRVRVVAGERVAPSR